jgi:S-adenosylmethionine-diacylglycerol 3-amino-3-carboxypropyl transferase
VDFGSKLTKQKLFSRMGSNNRPINLDRLIFTQNWEDPESNHTALDIKSGDTIMAITSGGCNVLGFLLFDPAIIYSIDINRSQSYLRELKVIALKYLSYDEFVEFIGVKKSTRRAEFYKLFRKEMSKEALAFWDRNIVIVSKGLLMNGKYEHLILLVGKLIRFLQGKKRMAGLFSEKSLVEQKKYFDKCWNTRRFQFMFKIFFNKRVLAKRGLVEDYFHFDGGSHSFVDSFYNRSSNAFRNTPV